MHTDSNKYLDICCRYLFVFHVLPHGQKSKTRQKELYCIVFHSISSFRSRAFHQAEESSGPVAVRAPCLHCSQRKGWCKSSPQRLPNLKENRNTHRFKVQCTNTFPAALGLLGWSEYLMWTSTQRTHVSSAALFTLCSNTHCSSQGCRLAAQPSVQINIPNTQSQTRQCSTAFRVFRTKRWCVKSVKSSWKISTRTACLKTWNRWWRECKIVQVHGNRNQTLSQSFPDLFFARLPWFWCVHRVNMAKSSWNFATLQYQTLHDRSHSIVELRQLRVLGDT